jgi:hypothetical protein
MLEKKLFNFLNYSKLFVRKEFTIFLTKDIPALVNQITNIYNNNSPEGLKRVPK